MGMIELTAYKEKAENASHKRQNNKNGRKTTGTSLSRISSEGAESHSVFNPFFET
jgi:hypothetical protein